MDARDRIHILAIPSRHRHHARKVARRLKDAAIALAQSLHRQLQLAEPIALEGIGARDIENQFWPRAFERRLQRGVEGREVGEVARAVGELDVEVARLFAEWKVAHRVHRQREDRVIGREDRRRAVALVHVEIDDDDLTPLHRGTRASIRLSSLSSVAGRYVTLHPGANDAPAIENGGTIGPTRTEADFLAHIVRTVATDPAATRWRVIVDNLNIHCSERLVRWGAVQSGLDDVDLGEKEKRDILKSRTSRAACRSDPRHRIVFQSTPKPRSWLNQIELWRSILTRKLLTRGHFTSLATLEAKVLAFIDSYNQTMAKPFQWTYHGKPLHV